MGLYINNREHPGVFRNTNHLVEPNQVEFLRDSITDFIEEQLDSNQSLKQAFKVLSDTQNRLSQQQSRRWQDIEERLVELKYLTSRHEQLEHDVIDWLEKLDTQNTTLHSMMDHEQLEKKKLVQTVKETKAAYEKVIQQLEHDVINRFGQLENQNTALYEMAKQEQHERQCLMGKVEKIELAHEELMEQLGQFETTKEEIVNRLDQFTEYKQEVVQRLEQISTVNEEVLTGIDKQHERQEELVNQLSKIEENQQEVLTRVDNQEGFMERLVHQIDSVRFSLFERTNFLEEKIEKVYQYFLNSIHKVKNSPNKQVTLIASKFSKDEEDKMDT